MTRNLKRPSFVLTLLISSFGLGGFQAHAQNAILKITTPTHPAKPTATTRPVLLVDLSLSHKLILTCISPDGSCLSYLKDDAGFSSVLPTANKGDDFAGTTSPDGKWMAYYSSRTGAVNLWICDSQGMNQRALTTSDVSITSYDPNAEPPIRFSPDSKKIAYLHDGNVWICDLDGENAQTLTENGGVEAFAWSPSGTRIAYLHLGSLRDVATSGQPDELLLSDAYNYPTLCFSPDIKDESLYYFYNGLWRIHLTTRKQERLCGNFCFPNRIRCNLTGDKVAMLNTSTEGNVEVFQVSTNRASASAKPGDSSSQVTEGGASFPFYSNDGKSIYFQRDGELWRTGLDGTKAISVYPGAVFQVEPGQLYSDQASGACP